MSSLNNVGERQLIKNIKRVLRPPKDAKGADDDAAILSTEGKVAVCSDVVTFDRHMPDGMTYEQFGWTAAAVNFSDLAAMGARPTGLIVSLAMPDDMEESDLYDIVSGIDQCAEYCDTYVIGGDTKPGPGTISCTAIGDMEGRRPMMRNGANPGDVVALTGSLGAPAAGFAALQNGIDAEDAIFSLMTPVPMVKEGVQLCDSGKVTSCIDLSDGLASAANIICEQSRCGMEIIWEFLPISPDVDDVCQQINGSDEDMVLNWGGEYELLFTFPKEDVEALQRTGVFFSIIGHITGDDGVYIIRDEKKRRLDYGRY